MTKQPLNDRIGGNKGKITRKSKKLAAKYMSLRKVLCAFFEDSSGIASRDIEDGFVFVNGKKITNTNEPIFNDDIIEKRYEKQVLKIKVELPKWC